MKNLIYQYWDGNLTPGCIAGTVNMKKYADQIGATYLFEHNPKFVTNLGRYSPHYGAFKPIYTESFHEYDNVLFLDTDVFAVDGLEESIFDNFTADIGICTEPFQPLQRLNIGGLLTSDSDEQWAAAIKSQWNVDMPRTPEGLLQVYNSGVVMYSNKGLVKAKEKFIPFIEYVNLINSKKLKTFYTADQNYIHAMLQVASMDYIELDNGWNSFIHPYHVDVSKVNTAINDSRTKETKFVHIQLKSADHWDADTHFRITNLPQDKWNIPR